MITKNNRDGPTQKERGQRQSFARQAATPGQERRPLLLGFYVKASGQGDASPQGQNLDDYQGDGTPSSHVITTYEREPDDYFNRVSVTLVGAPDDGQRRVLVYDLLWGRWSRPPEDGDGDTDNSGRVGSPVPARPPGLTDGATAETDVPAPALTA